MLTNFPGIKTDHRLAPYSSYQIGGNADFFYDLKNLEDLTPLLEAANSEQIPVRVIGGGTNILFKDEGFKGLIIRMMAKNVEVKENVLIADAGTRINMVIMAAQKAGFNCLDPLTGLPGTIGGAVYGNAGACGLELKDIVSKVELLNPQNGIYLLSNKDMEFGYRTSHLKIKKSSDAILRVFLQLSNVDNDGRKKSEDSRSRQPAGLTCGCWFTNPPGNSAGKLIDESGLKGYQVGGAQISEKHANFIINLGNATAADILAVAEHAKKTVKDKTGIELEDEVRVI